MENQLRFLQIFSIGQLYGVSIAWHWGISICSMYSSRQVSGKAVERGQFTMSIDVMWAESKQAVVSNIVRKSFNAFFCCFTADLQKQQIECYCNKKVICKQYRCNIGSNFLVNVMQINQMYYNKKETSNRCAAKMMSDG